MVMRSEDCLRGLDYLDRLTGYEMTSAAPRRSTTDTERLLAELGNPHRTYPAIHVTGTNGKGSTSAMAAALLTEAGLRVGLYTSPHLIACGERIRVDGKPATDDDLNGLLDQVRAAADKIGLTPSWFEALTVAGLLRFAQADIDVAVVEVGMLGRWDATNVLNAATVVITNVDLDHMEFAGNSRTAIAREKAGIIHRGATLVLGEGDPDLQPIFTERQPARVLRLGRDYTVACRSARRNGQTLDIGRGDRTLRDVDLPLIGDHQARNAVVALAAAEAHLGTSLSERAVVHALGRIRLPGRLHTIAGGQVIVDVAHNPAGAAAVRAGVDEAFGSQRRRVLVVGTLRGRDPSAFLAALGAGSADTVVATQPRSPRRLPAAQIAAAAELLGSPIVIEPDPLRALHQARGLAHADGVVVVTGSHLLAGTVLGASSHFVEELASTSSTLQIVRH
jgi:dihydrofolate synthase/folylpolyglutamate synthase